MFLEEAPQGPQDLLGLELVWRQAPQGALGFFGAGLKWKQAPHGLLGPLGRDWHGITVLGA